MEFKAGDKIRIKPYEEVTNHLGIDKRDWDKLKDTYTLKEDIEENRNFYEPESGWIIPNEVLVKLEDVKPSFKIEESTFTPTFKHKVGDIVQIKSLDWYYANKTKDGCVPTPLNYNNSFVEEMTKYCGKQYIVKLKNDYNYALADLDNKETIKWAWQDYMFEDSIIENATVDKYSIGSTFTSNGNTYIVVEKPKGGCIGCDLMNIYEECNSDRPRGFECINNMRSDNKYVIAKKITPDKSENLEVTDKYPIGFTLKHEDKEYVVQKSTNSNGCDGCDGEDCNEGICIREVISDFDCVGTYRIDKTDVVLKLIDNTNTSKNKYPINSIFTDNGNTFRIKKYTGNHSDYSVLKCRECAGNRICPSDNKDPEKFSCQSDYREDKTSVILELVDNISEIKTKDVPNLLNWHNAGVVIRNYGLQQKVYAMLSNNNVTELNSNVLSLSEMEKIPSITVNSEIKLESITIEYGIL